MGIPLIKGPFNDECRTCFAPDKTPVDVWASISGVTYGDQWTASTERALNGVHQLKNSGACVWQATIGGWLLLYHSGSPPSFFRVTKAGHFDMFIASFFASCITHFVNSQTDPGPNEYILGQVSLSWTAPVTTKSIINVASKLNIAENEKTFAEVFPVDSDKNVYRYAKKKDATNVKILFDHT